MHWPVDTDLILTPDGRVILTPQHILVHIVIQAAFANARAALLSQHAFPNILLAQSFARDALLAAAESHRPGTTIIHRRLLRDAEYVGAITPLVSPVFFVQTLLDEAFHRYKLGCASFGAKSKLSATYLSKTVSRG